LFYLLITLVEIEDSGESFDNLLNWFSIVIDMIIFGYVKKEISQKLFNCVKTEVENTIELFKDKIQISKNLSMIISSIQCIDSKFLKYIKSQERDDLIIENLFI